MTFKSEVGSLLAKAGKARWNIAAYDEHDGYRIDLDNDEGLSLRVFFGGDSISARIEDGNQPEEACSLSDVHVFLNADLHKPAPTAAQIRLIAAAAELHRIYRDTTGWWDNYGPKVNKRVPVCLAAGWLTEVAGETPLRTSAVPTALGRKVAGLESR